MNKTTAIIVAAGEASRMKTIKQLLPLGETTLLGKVIMNAQDSGVDEVITVLGAHFEKISDEIAPFITKIVKNENWQEGLGTSIAAGMKDVLQNEEQPEAVLILLGDQPLIDADYLRDLVKAYRMEPSKMMATRYPHSKGVPAVFPAAYFNELAQLTGDSGAKDLLNRDESEVATLDPGNRTLDIDTPEDYRQIRNISE